MSVKDAGVRRQNALNPFPRNKRHTRQLHPSKNNLMDSGISSSKNANTHFQIKSGTLPTAAQTGDGVNPHHQLGGIANDSLPKVAVVGPDVFFSEPEAIVSNHEDDSLTDNGCDEDGYDSPGMEVGSGDNSPAVLNRREKAASDFGFQRRSRE
ncbi:dynein heavy chain [Corchorus olitorius]|uniref:Dynein heavy chain n=1 Tax=Corchorus olitorius TaxID=93759 RepID=A0A1R3JU23_9ROSI|nr:dynein heavy chain [Corchorus olitorius]